MSWHVGECGQRALCKRLAERALCSSSGTLLGWQGNKPWWTLIVVAFKFLALIKNTEGIVFNRVFTLFNNFAAIKAFPAFKINEVIKERLHYH